MQTVMAFEPAQGDNTVSDKLEAFRAKIRDEPNNGALWIQYGDFIDEEYDMPDELVRAYENAAKLLPDKDLRLRIGDAYVNAGRPDVGLPLIKDSVSQNPRAHGFCILAGAFLRVGDYESAKEAAEHAIRADPDFEEGYYLLGEANRQDSPEEAVACFRAAIERDQNYALAWQALGRELAANDETILEGISALRRAIELNNDDGWAMAFLANALWRIDDPNEAERWYQRASEVFPDCEEIKTWHAQFRGEA